MSNSNSSIRLICSIDEPSFNKAKEAIRQLRAEVHRLANATDRVNLENMLGRGSSSPGGGFSFSDKAGAKPSDPAMNAKVSGPGKAFVQGLNVYKSQIQGISRLGVTALSELTSAVAHANQSQKRHLDEMTQSVQKLASAYQALGKQSGGLGGGMAPGGAGSPNNRNLNNQNASQLASIRAELARPATFGDPNADRAHASALARANVTYQKDVTKLQEQALKAQGGYDAQDAAASRGRLGRGASLLGGIGLAGRAVEAGAHLYDYTRFAKEDSMAAGSNMLTRRFLGGMMSGDFRDIAALQGGRALGGGFGPKGSFGNKMTNDYMGTGSGLAAGYGGAVGDFGSFGAKVLGGATIGTAVGGPIGAVAGGLTGAMSGLSDFTSGFQKAFGVTQAGSAQTHEARNIAHGLDVYNANEPFKAAFWDMVPQVAGVRTSAARRLQGNVDYFAGSGAGAGYTLEQSMGMADSDVSRFGLSATMGKRSFKGYKTEKYYDPDSPTEIGDYGSPEVRAYGENEGRLSSSMNGSYVVKAGTPDTGMSVMPTEHTRTVKSYSYAGGLFKNANDLAARGLDRDTARDAMGMLGMATPGGRGESSNAAYNMLKDAMAIGVARGFTSPQVAQELASAVAEGTSMSNLEGGSGINRLATLYAGTGDIGADKSIREMRSNLSAVQAMDSLNTNNGFFQQMKMASTQQSLGADTSANRMGLLATANIPELLAGSERLSLSGVTEKQRFRAAGATVLDPYMTALSQMDTKDDGARIRAEVAGYGEGQAGFMAFAASTKDWRTDPAARKRRDDLREISIGNNVLAPNDAAMNASADVAASIQDAIGPNATDADRSKFESALGRHADVTQKIVSESEKAKLAVFSTVLKEGMADVIKSMNVPALLKQLKEEFEQGNKNVDFKTGNRYVVQVIGPAKGRL